MSAYFILIRKAKQPTRGCFFYACTFNAFFIWMNAVIEKPIPYMAAIDPKPIAASRSLSMVADMPKKHTMKRTIPMSDMIFTVFILIPFRSDLSVLSQ